MEPDTRQNPDLIKILGSAGCSEQERYNSIDMAKKTNHDQITERLKNEVLSEIRNGVKKLPERSWNKLQEIEIFIHDADYPNASKVKVDLIKSLEPLVISGYTLTIEEIDTTPESQPKTGLEIENNPEPEDLDFPPSSISAHIAKIKLIPNKFFKYIGQLKPKAKVEKLEIIVNSQGKPMMAVANGDYLSPFNVQGGTTTARQKEGSWDLLLKLAKDTEEIPYKGNKKFLDYFNSQPGNPIFQRYLKTSILHVRHSRIEPKIYLDYLTEEELKEKQIKLKKA